MSDLIDRQATKDTFHAYLPGLPWDKLDAIVDEVPSAQPEGYTDQIRWERDMAIQQLKELGYGLGEKPRTDGDAISRQAAIDATLKDPIGRLLADKYNLIGFLEGLPSAQPERKKGNWIKPTAEKCLVYDENVYPECSACGEKEFFGWKKNYCPNCGADMRGEDHETD